MTLTNLPTYRELSECGTRIPGEWKIGEGDITEQMDARGRLIGALREASKAAVYAGNTDLAVALAGDADRIPLIDLMEEWNRRDEEANATASD